MLHVIVIWMAYFIDNPRQHCYADSKLCLGTVVESFLFESVHV
jgi:hypothetical protein